jgi:hypothetical protein
MEDLGYQVYKLSTGKMFYPRAAYVFIYEVKEGDGGTVGEYMYELSDEYNPRLAKDLTKDEAKEVAEYMIKIWTEFANSLK